MACKRCKTISFTSLHNMELVEVTCPRQQSPAQHAAHCGMKHSGALGEYARPYTVASGRNAFIGINADFSGVRVWCEEQAPLCRDNRAVWSSSTAGLERAP